MSAQHDQYGFGKQTNKIPVEMWEGFRTGPERLRPSAYEQSKPKNPADVTLSAMVKSINAKCEHLEKEINLIKKTSVSIIKIGMISGKRFKTPLDVAVELDEPGFIARAVDLPLYGHGDDAYEAIEMLKAELNSLYADLMEDDNFSDEWLNVKKYLQENIQE
jgi:hypothetical protein